jgi:hypothetical protein
MTMVTGLCKDVSSAHTTVTNLLSKGFNKTCVSIVYRNKEEENTAESVVPTGPSNYAHSDEGREAEEQAEKGIFVDNLGFVFRPVAIPDVGNATVAGQLVTSPATDVQRQSDEKQTELSEGLQSILSSLGFSDGIARANTEAVRRGRPLLLVDVGDQESDSVRVVFEQSEVYNIGTSDGEHCP